MNTKISVLLPTRGRKLLAESFINTAFSMSITPDEVEFILYVDEDDLESQEIRVRDVNIKIIIGPRCNMGVCNTKCLEVSDGEIIVLGNDDVLIRTEGWDEMIRLMHHSIPDHIYLAYPNDLNKGEGLSAFPILSRKTCELVSQPFPIIYKGAFIDTHIMEIFIRLKKMGKNRIIYLSKIVFEHLHFRIGKAKTDQTYKDRDRFADDMVFLSLHNIRKNTAKFLMGVINEKVSVNNKYQYTDPLIITRPTTLMDMIKILTNLYLFDSDLPLRNRIKNYLYHLARWVASSIKIYT